MDKDPYGVAVAALVVATAQLLLDVYSLVSGLK
jgi:hypothetical protein